MTAIGRLLRASSRGLCLAAALAALVPGCERGPSPPPLVVRSVRKVEGAPARTLDVRFAPDGASVLVHEARPAAYEDGDRYSAHAISRRPIGGGAPKELFASETPILDFVPFGDGIAVLRTGAPPKATEEPLDGKLDEEEQRLKSLEEWSAMVSRAALYRASDSGAASRITLEGTRCARVVGSEDGQRIAFTTMRPNDSVIEGEIRILDAKTGLVPVPGLKGLVVDISSDGARLLVRRAPYPKQSLPEQQADDAKSVLMVTVKDQVPAYLPTSLKIGGIEVDTAGLDVRFMGDGLRFQSAAGAVYRSAFDGSNATRLANVLPAADQSPEPGARPDGGAPAPQRVRRLLGPRGGIFELRQEEGGAVDLSWHNAAKPDAREPIAKLEGPLAAYGPVTVDPAEKRVALALISDTSHDGVVDGRHDGAEIFVTDAAEGSLSFGRVPDGALAGELKRKIAAAAGVQESSVSMVPADGLPSVTVDLPRIEGEKAAALLDRAFAAARAIADAVGQIRSLLRLRVGPLELEAVRVRVEGGRPYLALSVDGVLVPDPSELPLVLHNPTTTLSLAHGKQTHSEFLENTGKEPTPPIEAVAVVVSGHGRLRERHEITAQLGSIEPGKRVPYRLDIPTKSDTEVFGPRFRAEGRHLPVYNRHTLGHTVDWLDAALEASARHGVRCEHPPRRRSYEPQLFVVRLTAEQAALPRAARDELLRKIAAAPMDHYKRFHRNEMGFYRFRFAAPGGGGWQLDEGNTAPERYEGEKPNALP